MAPGLIQGGLGLMQLAAGSRMNPQRPQYEIPAAAQEELAMSRMQQNGRMPGVNYAEQRINQNSAAAGYGLNRAATNPNQILNGLASIQMNANIASRGLMEAEAGDAIRRDSNLRRSLGVMAGYQNRKWEVDKMAPFQDAARTKAALIGGGLQNLSGGVGQALGGLMGAQMMQGQQGAQAAAGQGASQNPFANVFNLARMGNQYMRRDIQPLAQPAMSGVQSMPPQFLPQLPFGLQAPRRQLSVNAGDGLNYYPY